MAKRNSIRSNMFRKDPDVLPFFTLHPKTKVGSILRVLFVLCICLSCVNRILLNKGIMFLWAMKFSFLDVVAPMSIVFLLMMVALYKRMKTTFTKIIVPGTLIFFGISLVMSIVSMMAYTGDFLLSPKMMLANDDKIYVVMRTCELPKTVTVEENGVESEKYVRTLDAYRYSVRVPQAREGVSYTIEGEIFIPISDQIEYSVQEQWVDDNTFRLFIAKDTSEVGRGEIIVKFTPGETTPASEAATSAMQFRKEFVSGNGANKVYFYRESTKMEAYVDSPYLLTETDMRQIYSVFPRSAFIFVNLNQKTEGNIIVEPNGLLAGIQWEWNDERTVARLSAKEDSVGASGSILIYLEETGAPKATWVEATPAEATPAEATPAESTPAESTPAESTPAESTPAESTPAEPASPEAAML